MTADDQSQPPAGQAESEAREPLFSTLPVELGGYRLTRLLGCHAGSDFYLARQSHVERRVVLEVLCPTTEDAEAQVARFRSTARARVAAHLPHVAPVLDSATSPEGYAYISQQRPTGSPLSLLAAEGRQLTVQQACDLVTAASALYEACSRAGLAAAPLTADMVFMDQAGAFSFLSPVLDGTPAEGDTVWQLHALATAMRSVQPLNVPGQTRVDTLLRWMQEGYEGEALDWSSAANTATLIAEQLKPDTLLTLNHRQRYDQGRVQRAGKRRQRLHKRNALFIAAAAVFILAMGVAGAMLAPEASEPIPALRGGYVHARVEGRHVAIAARPVSLAEYRRFLEAYPSLEPSRQGSLTQNIPPAESDPTPAGWEAQLTAAGQNTDAPVTNVSYWQALMYARYQRATLPSATLLAAARAEAGEPGVEEWTQSECPATPPYTKARIVLPAAAAASPLPENNPAARNPQRGFRICP